MCLPAFAAAATTTAAAETLAMSAWLSEASALPAWASTAMDIGALGMQVVGSMNQAEAQRRTYEYQSQVARNNAITAEQNAQAEAERGAREEQNQRLKVASLFGDQRAQLAANGVDLGEGSAAELLTTTRYMGERDALTIRDNASRRALAYRNQSAQFESDAGYTMAAGRNINPFMAGASTLLTGARSVADRWYRRDQAGKDSRNYQVGTKGYSGNYLEFDP